MFRRERRFSKNIQNVLCLSDTEGKYPTPIDLNIKNKTDIQLPDLQWNHYEDIAHKMKIINNGQSVVMTAKWKGNRPSIKSGPLPEEYIFSQLHFHWGNNDDEGSEHSVEGRCFPMEMHAVHFKSSYLSQKEAHQKTDGMIVLVYLFSIEESDNKKLTPLVSSLPSITEPYSTTHIVPSSLEDYIPQFYSNYFMYWGEVSSAACNHEVLWFICREQISISRSQLYIFRNLQGPDFKPMDHPFCGVQPFNNRSLFLVDGGTPSNETLVPISSNRTPRKASLPTDFWPFYELTDCENLQSPIDIDHQRASVKQFPPLIFTDLLGEGGRAQLRNTGCTVQVILEDRLPLLEGGPLCGSFKFCQLHFHWSLDDGAGTEHSIDGEPFSMESHAVHIHMRCDSIEHALERENSIAVVANMLQISENDNVDFLPISENLQYVVEPDSITDIPANCFNWLQNNSEYGYFTYPGSLTSPEETKTVTWIVFPDPIYISLSQLEKFRQIQNKDGQVIGENRRETQELNNRDIFLAV